MFHQKKQTLIITIDPGKLNSNQGNFIQAQNNALKSRLSIKAVFLLNIILENVTDTYSKSYKQGKIYHEDGAWPFIGS
jgi:hypothetical protein